MAENSKGRGKSGGNQESGRSNEGQSKKTSNRGFASMDPEQQREIARKGGEAVSEDREHMSEIGKKGGEASGGRRNR
jgi:uncharacterized protein